MTTDPQQQQMIREAMKAIAERRPGRSKLVYDKTKRTIVAVTEGSQTPRALNITADDADMFAVVTLSSRWLQEQWPHIHAGHAVAHSLSVLGMTAMHLLSAISDRSPSPSFVEGVISARRRDSRTGQGSNLRIVLTPVRGSCSEPVNLRRAGRFDSSCRRLCATGQRQ